MRIILAIVAILLAVSAYAVQFKLSEEEQARINRLYFNTDAFCHVVNRPKGAVFTHGNGFVE